MIGKSLSFCVKDICEDKVAIQDVTLIIAGTFAKNKASWNELLESYSKSYWFKYPRKAKAVANLLLYSGRIFQPRAANLEPLFGQNIWIDGAKQIEIFMCAIQAALLEQK